MKKMMLISVVLVISCGPDIKSDIETFRVKRGEFNIEVVATGEIQAVEAVNISSPAMSWRFGQLKITRIVDDGTEVVTGDTVICFDPSEVEKAIVDARMELEIAEAELEKLRAEQESKIYELEADFRIAEIAHEISKLKLEQAVYEPEITQKEISLNLDKARINLNKAAEEIENQKKIHIEEVQQQKLKISQLEANLEEARRTLRSLTVVSSGEGIAVIRKNWRTGGKWQVGDQTWSGNPMIDLPDMRVLRVLCEINEVDISKIALNQKAEIKLDAFSDSVFFGQVSEIAALAKIKGDQQKSKIKVFPVKVLIEGSHAQLLPGMTISCKIIVDRLHDVLYVPLEAVHPEEGHDYIFIRKGKSFKKCEVLTGRSNNDFIVIEKGVSEGDEAALSSPMSQKGAEGEQT